MHTHLHTYTHTRILLHEMFAVYPQRNVNLWEWYSNVWWFIISLIFLTGLLFQDCVLERFRFLLQLQVMYCILYIFIVHFKFLQGSWIYQIIMQIHLARLEAICLWLNTQVLNQSVSHEELEAATGMVYMPAREETLHSKIKIVAPQKVGTAVTASVVSDLEGKFYWKKSKEHHWRLFSVEDVFTLLPTTVANSLALLAVGLSNCWSDWLKLTLVDCKKPIGLLSHLPSTFSKQFIAVPSQMVLYNKPSGASSRYSLVL